MPLPDFVQHKIAGAPEDPVSVRDLQAVQDAITAALGPVVKVLSGAGRDIAGLTADYAPLDSPAFTGDPTAPTPALGDNDTSLATTAFVERLAGKDRGCVPANGTDVANDWNFSAGELWDDTFVIRIPVAAIAGKQLDVDWAAGASAGLRDSSVAIGNNTYHVYLIAKAEGADADYMAFRNGDTVTLPTGYLYKRRVFTFRRIGAVNQAVTVKEISGSGLEVLLSTPAFDFTKSWAGGMDDAAQTGTLALVPLGIQMEALLAAAFNDSTPAVNSVILMTAADQADTAPSANVASYVGTFQIGTAGAVIPQRTGGDFEIRISTTATFRYRTAGSTTDHTLGITTRGWRDWRAA